MLSCGEKLQDLELVRAVHRNDVLPSTPSTTPGAAKVATDRPSFAEPDRIVERELAEAVRVPPTMPPAAVEHVHTASDEIEEREEPIVIRTRGRAPVSNWPPLVGAPASAQRRTSWAKPAVLATLAVLACAMTFVYYRGSGVSTTITPSPAGTAPSAPVKPRAVTMRVTPAPQASEPVMPQPAPAPVPARAVEAPVRMPTAEPLKTLERVKETAPERVTPAATAAPAHEAAKAGQAAPAAAAPAAIAPPHRSAARARPEPRRIARRENPVVEPEPEVRTVVVPIVRPPPPEHAQGGINCTDILQRASLGSLTAAEEAQLRKGCE
jgi:hypothetical protein